MRRERSDDEETIKAKLRLAEGYFYAKNQISRIDYQFLDRYGESRLNERKKQVGLMIELAGEIEKTLGFIERRKDKCSELPEWGYYKQSFATIHYIALWTAGRHAVRVCH